MVMGYVPETRKERYFVVDGDVVNAPLRLQERLPNDLPENGFVEVEVELACEDCEYYEDCHMDSENLRTLLDRGCVRRISRVRVVSID